MRVHRRLSLRTTLPTLALTLALPLVAWKSIELLTLQPESKLWVDGTSTVRSWSCKAGDVDAVVEAAPNAISQVVAGEKGVHAVRVRVQSEKLDCGNPGTGSDVRTVSAAVFGSTRLMPMAALSALYGLAV